jgi:hypothetical protein
MTSRRPSGPSLFDIRASLVPFRRKARLNLALR